MNRLTSHIHARARESRVGHFICYHTTTHTPGRIYTMEASRYLYFRVAITYLSFSTSPMCKLAYVLLYPRGGLHQNPRLGPFCGVILPSANKVVKSYWSLMDVKIRTSKHGRDAMVLLYKSMDISEGYKNRVKSPESRYSFQPNYCLLFHTTKTIIS